MMNYVCPICNTRHESVDSLEACVSNCAKKARKVEQEQKRAKQEQLAKELKERALKEKIKRCADDLKIKEADIRECFTKLMSYVEEYNRVAAELRTMNVATKTCSASLSFSHNEEKVSKAESKKVTKSEDKNVYVDISSLLQDMLEF